MQWFIIVYSVRFVMSMRIVVLHPTQFFMLLWLVVVRAPRFLMQSRMVVLCAVQFVILSQSQFCGFVASVGAR